MIRRAETRGDSPRGIRRGKITGFQGFRGGPRWRLRHETHRVAALADDDVTGHDLLTAVLLDAEVLGVGVAAVLGGAGTLLVRSLHGEAEAHGSRGGLGHGHAGGGSHDRGASREAGHERSHVSR